MTALSVLREQGTRGGGRVEVVLDSALAVVVGWRYEERVSSMDPAGRGAAESPLQA